MDNILPTLCKILSIDPDTVEAEISFVGEAEIKNLNRDFRGIDKATDVLSFPDGDINPETGKRFLGDVIICESVAAAQAAELNQSTEREIAFLTVHGLLHLLGYDHETPDDETKMRELQRKIMDNLF